MQYVVTVYSKDANNRLCEQYRLMPYDDVQAALERAKFIAASFDVDSFVNGETAVVKVTQSAVLATFD